MFVCCTTELNVYVFIRDRDRERVSEREYYVEINRYM